MTADPATQVRRAIGGQPPVWNRRMTRMSRTIPPIAQATARPRPTRPLATMAVPGTAPTARIP